MAKPVRPLSPVERAVCLLLAEPCGVGLLMARLLDADDSVAMPAALVMAVDPDTRQAIIKLLNEVQSLGDAGLLVAELPLAQSGGGR